jgi:hypothetical protein|tara:strand:- start:843 stop:1124 length:282 start_codon:yes stop_codon:yes gene_type:complete
MKRREVLLILATLGLMITVVLADRFLLLEKIDSLEEKVDIHNDIVTGKATYVPGHACMIRAGHEDLPADIVRYARACAKGHEQWLLLQKEDEE